MPGTGAGEVANAAPSDIELLSFAYVDFGGSALPADKLTTEPGAEMVHLMPFAIRVVIDQRRIDAFLVALAASSIPIDVRQIRINADGTTNGFTADGGMGGLMPMGPAGPNAFAGSSGFPSTAGLRRYDVRLEIRGTVALATKPGDPVMVAPQADRMGRDWRRSPTAMIRDRRHTSPITSGMEERS